MKDRIEDVIDQPERGDEDAAREGSMTGIYNLQICIFVSSPLPNLNFFHLSHSPTPHPIQSPPIPWLSISTFLARFDNMCLMGDLNC